MTKRTSEGDFGHELRAVALPIYVYKPPDDANNRKPCDFMAWHQEVDPEWNAPRVRPTWFEVKDVNTVEVFSWRREIRQSQSLGMVEAERLGIPYWLAVYWRKHKTWTISDALKMRAATRMTPEKPYNIRTFKRQSMMSTLGIDSTPANLRFTLRAVLQGEVG